MIVLFVNHSDDYVFGLVEAFSAKFIQRKGHGESVVVIHQRYYVLKDILYYLW